MRFNVLKFMTNLVCK